MLHCRAKDGMVEIHKDQGLAENPMDRIDEKLTAKVFLQCYSRVIWVFWLGSFLIGFDQKGFLILITMTKLWCQFHFVVLFVCMLLLLNMHCNMDMIMMLMVMLNMMFRQRGQKVSTKCWLLLVKENKPFQAFKWSGHCGHRGQLGHCHQGHRGHLDHLDHCPNHHCDEKTITEFHLTSSELCPKNVLTWSQSHFLESRRQPHSVSSGDDYYG